MFKLKSDTIIIHNTNDVKVFVEIVMICRLPNIPRLPSLPRLWSLVRKTAPALPAFHCIDSVCSALLAAGYKPNLFLHITCCSEF